jgi:Uma2 family endonuclease
LPVAAEAGITVPRAAHTFFVADLAITRAPREPGRQHVVDPVIVVEVPSPSTEEIDRCRKVMEYRQITSVQAILLLTSDAQQIELQRRTASRWTVEDLIGQAELTLNVCTSPIPLDSIYGDLLGAGGAGGGSGAAGCRLAG